MSCRWLAALARVERTENKGREAGGRSVEDRADV